MSAATSVSRTSTGSMWFGVGSSGASGKLSTLTVAVQGDPLMTGYFDTRT